MKYWIGIGASIGLMVLFLLTVDVRRMLDALGGANFWFLIPAVGMYLVSTYFRSLRWTVMLRHLKPLSAVRVYPVVVIGYMANNLLPMRLGELVRSYYLGEREGINKASALVTVVVERVFDAMTLLFFIAVVALFVPVSGLARSFGAQAGVPWPLLIVGFSLPFVCVFGALVLFAAHPRRTHAAVLCLARPLPAKLRSLLDSLVVMLLQGLTPLRDPRTMAVLFALSVPIWLTEVAVFYIMGFSFDIDDAHTGPGPMAATMTLVTSITNIGSSVPAAPGGIGLFEIIARETLVFASVDRSVAAGFAVVVHAAILLPMIVLGQLFLWANHISLRRLSREGGREKVSFSINRAGPPAPDV